jgi:hypothetical protein
MLDQRTDELGKARIKPEEGAPLKKYSASLQRAAMALWDDAAAKRQYSAKQ